MLRADIIVIVQSRLIDRELQHALGARREGDLPDRQRTALGRDHVLDCLLDLVEVDAEPLQCLRSDALALANDPEQEMLRPDVIVLHTPSLVPR